MAEKFDPSQTGPVYDQHAPRWQQEMDFAEMTRDVLMAGTYLPKFSSKEHEDDYAYRREMSCPLDMLRDAVRIRVDNLFRSAPKRDFDGSKYKHVIEPLVANADGEGNNLNSFMQRALFNSYVSGADIVTQMGAVPEGQDPPVTVADSQAQGIAPYFSLFRPIERVDWAANGARNFLWARYSLGEPPRETEDSGDLNAVDYLTLAADGYRVWRVIEDSTVKDTVKEVILLREGVYPLNAVPVTKLYFSESDKPGQGCVPIGLISRACDIARVMLNLKSQADAELLAAVPRWLASGFMAGDPKNGIQGELPDAYGGGMMISAGNPEADIKVIQGNVSHITEKREWLILYIGEMLRLLKFRGGMAELSGNAGSGVKLAIERTDMDNELRTTAEQMEAAELEMMRQAVVLATGEQIERADAADVLGYSAQYNRDFVLEPVGEMLASIREWVTGGFVSNEVPSITKEMLRQLANMLAREGTKPHDEMLEEIDGAELVGAAEPMEDPEEDDEQTAEE